MQKKSFNEQEPLKTKNIQITGIELVEKGNDEFKWKELNVIIKDYVKGVHYSIPLKKVNGEETFAYKFYKKNMAEWQESFANDLTVDIGIGYSEKKVKWEKDGNSGISTYRTIRFFSDLSSDLSDKT